MTDQTKSAPAALSDDELEGAAGGFPGEMLDSGDEQFPGEMLDGGSDEGDSGINLAGLIRPKELKLNRPAPKLDLTLNRPIFKR